MYFRILEEFICDNLEINPFDIYIYITDMTNERNKIKEENKTFLQTLTKKFPMQHMVVV